MGIYKLISISLSLFFVQSLSGQCPDRDFLYKHILYLRDSSQVLPKDQLRELLPYEEKIKTCAYRNDSTNALLLARIGWLYSTQKDYINAIKYTKKSIEIINQHLSAPSTNRTYLIKFYFNLFIFYDSLKQDRLKTNAIDSCILLSSLLKVGYQYSVPLIYLRTQNLFEIGDYYRCMGYAQIGENIVKESGYQIDNIYYYSSYRVNSLIQLKKYDEAETLVSKIIIECQKHNIDRYFGVLYNLYSTISQQKGDFGKALTLSKRSIYYDLKIKNFVDCAATLTNIGFNIYFLRLRRYDSALTYYLEALKYADINESINIFDNIANVYVETKNYDSAFVFFQKAFDLIKPGLNERELPDYYQSDIINQIKIEYVVGLMLDKAEAHLKEYGFTKNQQNLLKAIDIYKATDRLLDRIKTSHTELSSKLFWRENNRRLYENAIDACYLANNTDDAYYFFEKSRAVLLNDQLLDQYRMNNESILQLAQVKKKILQLERDMNEKNESKQKEGVQNDLFLMKQELEQREQKIKQENPLYYQNVLDTVSISLIDARKIILKDHDALLELFEGDSAVYSLLMTAENVQFNKISKKDFDTTVQRYIYYISNQSTNNRYFKSFVHTSYHLYGLIFQNTNLPSGRIIISPDSRYFPFESLVTNASGPPVFFLQNNAVSYTYSARYLLNNFGGKSSGIAGNFFGIAPVHYPPSFSLPNLMGSAESLREIGSYFDGANILVSERSTKSNFLRQYAGYRIIQLYTHASDSGANGEPVIYFADSVLYLSDLIAESKPQARLIVLSACETGKGKLYLGEGVFSFNRGFATMGIPSSIINLWSVDNQSTYRITELFYKYLSGGIPVDVALQKAKLEFIQTSSANRLPFYWAAAIVAGKTDGFDLENKYSWRAYAVIAVSIIGAFFLFFWRRQRIRVTQSNRK
jgi:CHAT domain-containing protein